MSTAEQATPAEVSCPPVDARRSRSALLLLILGPLLMDIINSMTMLWLNLQAAREGIPPRSQALIGTATSLGFALSSYLASRYATPAIASRLLLLAVLAAGFCAAAAVMLSGYWFYLATSLALGVCVGHYFTPLQVKMGQARPFHTVAWTIAVYNISWGVGMTAGPLITGSLADRSRTLLLIVLAAIVAAQSVLILNARHSLPPRVDAARPAFTSTYPLRLIGWITTLTGTFYLSALAASLWPGLGVARGWSTLQISVGVAALMVGVPAAAPLWALLRRRLQRPWLLITLLPAAAVAMFALPLVRGWPAAVACMAVLGLVFSCVMYHSIYYSNTDPTDPTRSVGLNETFNGLGSTAGPVLLGLLAWDDFTALRPYAAAAAMLLASFAVAIWLGRQTSGNTSDPRKVDGSQPSGGLPAVSESAQQVVACSDSDR